MDRILASLSCFLLILKIVFRPLKAFLGWTELYIFSSPILFVFNWFCYGQQKYFFIWLNECKSKIKTTFLNKAKNNVNNTKENKIKPRCGNFAK